MYLYARMPLCCDFEEKGDQAAKNSNRRHTWLLVCIGGIEDPVVLPSFLIFLKSQVFFLCFS